MVVERAGETERVTGDIVDVACGAISSAALLLRSAMDRHPRGLANGSDAVGFLGQRIPLAGVAHKNGTIRFGDDPGTSALDPHWKAQELDNLYVVDGSFFPSSAAVNPALTVMANALRVGDHLLGRLR